MQKSLKKPPGTECAVTPGGQQIPAAKVLVISHSGEYHSSLKRILEATPFHVIVASTYREAVAALCTDRVPVIVCQCRYQDGNWKDILSQIAPLLERPRVIVTSREAEDLLRLEAKVMGASRVLAEPLDPDRLTQAVTEAWHEWRKEQHRSWEPQARAAAV